MKYFVFLLFALALVPVAKADKKMTATILTSRDEESQAPPLCGTPSVNIPCQSVTNQFLTLQLPDGRTVDVSCQNKTSGTANTLSAIGAGLGGQPTGAQIFYLSCLAPPQGASVQADFKGSKVKLQWSIERPEGLDGTKTNHFSEIYHVDRVN